MTNNRTSPTQALTAPPARVGSRRGLLVLILVMAAGLLAACGGDDTGAGGPVQVGIISLDHAPIRPVVDEVSDLVAGYGDDVVLTTYHFDTPEGDSFASENGLDEHTPIAIFVDGESTFDLEGRGVVFMSFPAGSGTGVVADGDWSIEDLRAVLDRAVSEGQAG